MIDNCTTDALQQQDMEELEMFDVFDGDDSSESEYEDS